MDKIRWGILSTGRIASVFVESLKVLPDAEILAVGSRSQASADTFGEQHGIPRRYGSYEALVADPDVDVIYIGSPHSHHHEHMRLALEHDKHVLCEKAFTINARQAEDVITLARSKNLFLMEAMWTRFLPAIVRLRELLADQVIGPVRYMQAMLCVHREYDPEDRLYKLALGGGALLDLGIYPIALTTMVMGLPDTVQSQMTFGPSGADELTLMQFNYQNGSGAQLACALRMPVPYDAIIAGEGGVIRVHHPAYRPHHLTLELHGDTPQPMHLPFESRGYQHEAQEVMACIRAGRLESSVMPLDETLAIMRLMDGIRAAHGLVYPGE